MVRHLVVIFEEVMKIKCVIYSLKKFRSDSELFFEKNKKISNLVLTLLNNSNVLYIDNDSYKYSIISTNEEYYTNGVDTYVIVDIGLELSDNYKYVNLVLELKLLKDDKRVFDYLFK